MVINLARLKLYKLFIRDIPGKARTAHYEVLSRPLLLVMNLVCYFIRFPSPVVSLSSLSVFLLKIFNVQLFPVFHQVIEHQLFPLEIRLVVC